MGCVVVVGERLCVPLCCIIGIVCGLPVVGGNFLEFLEEQDGAVVGAPPFRPSILNAHLRP